MQTRHVSAAIIYRNGRVLAARRAEGKQQAGLWELPGGKVEPGETPEQALRREISEELGCELRLCWLYDTVEHDYPDFHLSMDCFVCSLAPGSEPTADPAVHDELRWLTQDELMDVEWLPADTALASSLGYFWDEAFGVEHL